MKAEQWVVIRADPSGQCSSGNGPIEHATHRRSIDALSSDSKAYDASGEHIHDYQYPMAAQQYRLAPKQISAPQAILGLCDEGEPGGTWGVRMFRTVVSCEDPADDILVDLQAECMCYLLGDALLAESGIAKLHLEDDSDDFLCETLRSQLAPGCRGGE